MPATTVVPGTHLVARRTSGSRPPRRSGSTRRSPARRCVSIVPSAGTWSPVRSSIRSSSTTSAVGISISVAVPDHPGGRRVQQRQPVQLPLGQVLLHDADRRVDDQHHAEQPVGQRPGAQDQHEQRTQDRVEPGEDVGLEDHPQRPGRRLAGGVDLAAGDPLGDLGRRSGRWSGRPDVDAGGLGPYRHRSIRRGQTHSDDCDRSAPTPWSGRSAPDRLVFTGRR